MLEVVYHSYLTDQSMIDDLIKEVKRSECPHNSLESDHIFGDKLRVRRKNFNYWPREVRLKIMNGEENAYRNVYILNIIRQKLQNILPKPAVKFSIDSSCLKCVYL